MKKIKLTKGRFALVDDDDFEYLNQSNWNAVHNPNEDTFRVVGTITMSRIIMKCPADFVVDHINHDTLNNCKDNLRIVTRSQNMMNQTPQKNTSSKFKGVYWSYKSNKWITQIFFKGKHIHLGCFDDEVLASRVYNVMAKYLFGKYARLNRWDV